MTGILFGEQLLRAPFDRRIAGVSDAAIRDRR